MKCAQRRAGAEGENIVEGYAAVFERPTVLYTENGVEYCEIISQHRFLAGVGFVRRGKNYNHTGNARRADAQRLSRAHGRRHGPQGNGRLGGTQEARAMYEEIKGGYIDKMSFCFVADRSADTYENIPGRYTRRINRIKTVYDVAAVDFPAYDDTTLEARSAFAAEAAKLTAEAEKRRKKAYILQKTLEV